MKQVEVTILGQGYVLGCPEGGEALLTTAVAHVDREMSTIRDSGKVKARERIAVLAALNLAYQLAERRVAAPVAKLAVDGGSHAPGGDTGNGALNGPVDIISLMRRIDAVLDDDGHLL